MKKERFTGRILAGHKQAAVEVPFDPSVRWGIAASPLRPGRRGHAVRGDLAGVAFESFVVARSKRFWVLVEQEHLAAAGVAVGESVRISLEPSAS